MPMCDWSSDVCSSDLLCVSVSVCVHLRVCVRARMCLRVCVRACVRAHVSVRVCVHTCECAFVCTCVRVRTRVWICECVHARLCVCLHVCENVCVRARVCAQNLCLPSFAHLRPKHPPSCTNRNSFLFLPPQSLQSESSVSSNSKMSQICHFSILPFYPCCNSVSGNHYLIRNCCNSLNGLLASAFNLVSY